MKERRVTDERKTSRCLRTTVSAQHAVSPSISSSVCRSLSFLSSGSIQISPRLSSSFLSSLLLFLTTPSLPPSVSFFPLAVNTPLLIFLFVQLSLFSFLHLFFSLQSCLEVVFLRRENQSLHTQVYAALPPPTHTHCPTHTYAHT